MKRIPLFKYNKIVDYTLVDDKYYEELSKHTWHPDNEGYVVRWKRENGKMCKIWMHRIINNTPDNLLTDHINGNKKDNQEKNLRDATPLMNRQNTKGQADSITGIRGVIKIHNKNCITYRGYASKNGKTYNKTFKNLDAAKEWVRLKRLELNYSNDQSSENYTPITDISEYLIKEKKSLLNSNTSGYKGVYYHKRTQKYHSVLIKNKQRLFLGVFNTKIEARLAYIQKSLELNLISKDNYLLETKELTNAR